MALSESGVQPPGSYAYAEVLQLSVITKYEWISNCRTHTVGYWLHSSSKSQSIRAKCWTFIIKSRSARTHLRKILTSQTDFYKPRPRGMWRKRSSSQFQMANHRHWGIMGYNDVTVCVTVINLTHAFFFIGLDRSRLTNLDRSDFWLWTLPMTSYKLESMASNPTQSLNADLFTSRVLA